jgi:WD40 repeat protein
MYSQDDNIFDHIQINERTDYRESGECTNAMVAACSVIHKIYSHRLGARMLESKFHHQGDVPKMFGKLHDNPIKSICLSENFKYLFTSDTTGCIKKYDFSKKTLIKNFGQVHNARIVSIVCSKEYLLSVCDKGIVNQFEVNSMDLEQKPFCYGYLHDSRISAMVCTPKSDKYFFTSDRAGTLKQFDIQSNS